MTNKTQLDQHIIDMMEDIKGTSSVDLARNNWLDIDKSTEDCGMVWATIEWQGHFFGILIPCEVEYDYDDEQVWTYITYADWGYPEEVEYDGKVGETPFLDADFSIYQKNCKSTLTEE